MAKYLMSLRGGLDVTVGKVYEIERETPYAYYIHDDAGDERECIKVNEDLTYVAGTMDILATKRTQLATLTAEIAQLEARTAEESRLKVGDYARVVDGPDGGRFEENEIVMVSEIARAQSAIYPIGVFSPVLGYAVFEAFKPEHLVKITPEEARASLIAKIDAHFGGQEAK